MKIRTTLAALLLSLVLVSGCAHYSHAGRMLAEPPAAAMGEIPAFSYDVKIDQIDVRVEDDEESDRWTCRLVKFKVKDFKEGKNKYAKAYYYAPKNAETDAPCLVVLPPTGGPRELVKKFAQPFADEGYAVLGFQRRERFFRPDKPIEYNKGLFRQAVIDVRRGIDWMVAQPNIDSSRIAVLGVSLGGIIAALSTEADGRIKATATIVSAAHLPDVLDTSGYSVVRKLRKGIMEKEGVERDQLHQFAAERVHDIDPATYADRIDPARMIMINGRADNIIKYSVAKESWETFGKPEMHVIGTGHYSTMIANWYAIDKVKQHFLKVMAMELDKNGHVRPLPR